MNGRVTVCTPVYKGERFLRETLDAIQSQTFTGFDAVISIDGADPECERICSAFLSDHRFSCVVQPQRLGWVDNFNWILSTVQNEFCCYQQQDDLIDPTYLEVLVDHARREPSAAVVYTDLVSMGRIDGTLRYEPSVLGATPFVRVMTMVNEHLAAIAFRGLVRTDAMRASGPVRHSPLNEFGVDILWLSGLARYGELHRVPQPLYRKRYHDRNTESKWWAWPLDQRLEAWCHHCVEMVSQALTVSGSVQELRLMWMAGVGRLTALVTGGPFLQIEELEPAQYTIMLDRFLALAKQPQAVNIPLLLDADWPAIDEWTRASFWIPNLAPIEVVDFGPRRVAAGQPFNVQANGGSAVWVRANRRIPPGTRVRLGEVDLQTVITNDLVTAAIPASVTHDAGDRALSLVGTDGTARSNTVLFRVDSSNGSSADL